MPFIKAVLTAIPDLGSGHTIESSPYNVSSFEVWEEALVPGRFVKNDTGSIDLLDASGSPVIAGVVLRKIASAMENANYTKLGIVPDQVAEVVNFGFVTVDVVVGQNPVRFGQVYAVNATGADAGKATTVSASNVAVPGCVFWELKATNVWLVLVPKYLTGV